MDIATAIVTILISSPLAAVATHLLNRRARHAEARLQNAEADKRDLENKSVEVDHYRRVIKDLVSDMEGLKVAQDKTDKRYQENTDGLHKKIDALTTELQKANNALTKANKTIDELQIEVKGGGEKTDALVQQLNRANESLDAANKEIKGLREVITGLQEKVTELLMERAEKK